MTNLKLNDINEVLDEHIPKLTLMVAEGNAEAFLIAGNAGIGKTYGVEQTLKQFRKEHPDFHYDLVGGEISKIGLYKTLYDNRKGLIVFDDIDAVLASDCANLLKNALNSKKKRTVSYLKNNKDLFNAKNISAEKAYQKYIDSNRTEYPNTFQYEGACIFISNQELDKVDSAVKDRCIGTIFLDFSLEQIIDRIKLLINKLNPKQGTLSINEKYEVLQHLYDNYKIRGKKLSLRNFINALSYRVTFPEDGEWKELSDLYLN